ncbi:MAG TPA: hypothetical protein GX691_02250 [Clostridia bacterium]|jgi:hypothetical protein|nr:hypothetical protein [Clostridia bacterium]
MAISKDKLKIKPTNREIKIFYQLKERFDKIIQEQAEMYHSFQSSRDPAEREFLAKRIQALEEGIIHEVAQENNMTFDKVARAFCKVDLYLE